MTNRYMIEDFYKVVISINGSNVIISHMIEDALYICDID